MAKGKRQMTRHVESTVAWEQGLIKERVQGESGVVCSFRFKGAPFHSERERSGGSRPDRGIQMNGSIEEVPRLLEITLRHIHHADIVICNDLVAGSACFQSPIQICSVTGKCLLVPAL
jgi:hypothetical protein